MLEGLFKKNVHYFYHNLEAEMHLKRCIIQKKEMETNEWHLSKMFQQVKLKYEFISF
jgi:hypothetical protein